MKVMNFSSFRRLCLSGIKWLLYVTVFLALCGAGWHYFVHRERTLVFHPDWTETDRLQMKEVMTAMKEARKIVAGIEESDFDYNTSHLSTDKLDDWLTLCRKSYEYYKKKSGRDMFSYWEDAVVKTARTGNAAHIGKYNYTLLQAACGLGKRELACHLMDKGADVNVRNMTKRGDDVKPGDTAITQLCWRWFSDVPKTFNLETTIYLMEQLASQGADLNIRSADTICPFEIIGVTGFRYGKENCEKILFKLMDLGADVSSPFESNWGSDRKQSSSLEYPVRMGLDKVVERLCKVGVNPNEGYDRLPPLWHINLKQGPEYQANIARSLLDHGAQINAQLPSHLCGEFKAGRTPLIHLCTMLNKFPKADEKQKQCLLDLFSLYCERKVNVNLACEKGRTPLMYLLEYAYDNTELRIALARILLEHGADPSLKNKSGETVGDLIERDGITAEKIFKELPELRTK